MRCEDRFYETYGRDYDGLAFCPYRICPIGAHSDHNFGKITGLAIDKGIHFAYAAKQNGVVEVSSLQFPKRARRSSGHITVFYSLRACVIARIFVPLRANSEKVL